MPFCATARTRWCVLRYRVGLPPAVATVHIVAARLRVLLLVPSFMYALYRAAVFYLRVRSVALPAVAEFVLLPALRYHVVCPFRLAVVATTFAFEWVCRTALFTARLYYVWLPHLRVVLCVYRYVVYADFDRLRLRCTLLYAVHFVA